VRYLAKIPGLSLPEIAPSKLVQSGIFQDPLDIVNLQEPALFEDFSTWSDGLEKLGSLLSQAIALTRYISCAVSLSRRSGHPISSGIPHIIWEACNNNPSITR
jgi:hypothetical protein